MQGGKPRRDASLEGRSPIDRNAVRAEHAPGNSALTPTLVQWTAPSDFASVQELVARRVPAVRCEVLPVARVAPGADPFQIALGEHRAETLRVNP